ncbi:MAG: hypothetical protein KAG66_09485, partial [Methylococcales bacterium]|nr:hypothetical protein [Methylococcales bacterium]
TVLRRLQREVFVISLQQPVEQLPDLIGFDCRLVGDAEIEVVIDAQHTLNELFALLTEKGFTVQSMRNKANRLEEHIMGLVESRGSATSPTDGTAP